MSRGGFMDISITNVQLDLGGVRRGTDMGPSAIHVAGLVPRLTGMGHKIARVQNVGVNSYEASDVGAPNARFLSEITQCVSDLAAQVYQDLSEGQFPLVLGGDHAQAIGTIAAISRYLKERGQRLGVVWVDAHTDMNTPDTSPSGNIHGMPLAVLLGRGPKELLDIVGPEPALRPEDVVILGARDVDATEVPLVKELGVRVYTMSEIDERGIATCVKEAYAHVSENTDALHLSFDLDGVDPRHAPGVGTPVPGGLSLRESHFICEFLHRNGPLTGMEIVELNPTLDLKNQTGQLSVWLIESALGKRILGS